MRATVRGAAAAFAAWVCAAGAPAHAAFHFAVIDEVMSGLGADPTAQYVEIRTLLPGQKFVTDTRLSVFNCDGSFNQVLLLVPSDLCSAPSGTHWSMGTASWAAATGMTPDYTFPAGIPAPCGMVCWGAPGSFPPDPSTWDPSQLQNGINNYVDCVAYGAYTGALLSTSLPVAPSGPGDGTQSLQRGSTSFALAPRTPTNSGCPTVTSTTTPGGATTTTTLAGGGGGTSPFGTALSGGAPAKTDCYGEWRVAGATGTGHVVRCTDGTACDVGGGAGCTVRAQLCFDDAANALYKGKCTAASVTGATLSGPVKDATDTANTSAILAAFTAVGAQVSGSTVTFTPPLTSLHCTGPFDLAVPLKTKGAKTRKGSRAFRVVTTAGKKDADALKVICLP